MVASNVTVGRVTMENYAIWVCNLVFISYCIITVYI